MTSGARRLSVMISSKCKVPFPSGGSGRKSLSDIRKELKEQIESIEIGGCRVFDVWINEDASPQSGERDSWEECMKQAADCDIFISIFNGDAGWAPKGEKVGICHAELDKALGSAPAKVRVVEIAPLGSTANDQEQEDRNREFREYVSRQSLFRGGDIND